jgi:uncharacterized protein YqjF (DUF2071 family)
MPPAAPKVFLTAEWRNLAMLNYEIEPSVLAPFVPAGTELDSWQGRTYVSIVAFLFLRTRVRGAPIPFHQNFEEVNLRFYVRRLSHDGWRRGVVFIKELVPRFAIAFIARRFYNENYLAVPMRHVLEKHEGELKSAYYFWRYRGQENFVKLAVDGAAKPLAEGSAEEFITEHYWGYARQRDGSTMEYRVDHPRWNVWQAQHMEFHCQAADLYGDAFAPFLSAPPASAFLADGSEVKVYQGVKLLK